MFESFDFHTLVMLLGITGIGMIVCFIVCSIVMWAARMIEDGEK